MASMASSSSSSSSSSSFSCRVDRANLGLSTPQVNSVVLATAAETVDSKNKKIARSREGCYGCRARKKKCDLEKPICLSCQRLKQACQYPPQTLDPETGQWVTVKLPNRKLNERKPRKPNWAPGVSLKASTSPVASDDVNTVGSQPVDGTETISRTFANGHEKPAGWTNGGASEYVHQNQTSRKKGKEKENSINIPVDPQWQSGTTDESILDGTSSFFPLPYADQPGIIRGSAGYAIDSSSDSRQASFLPTYGPSPPLTFLSPIVQPLDDSIDVQTSNQCNSQPITQTSESSRSPYYPHSGIHSQTHLSHGSQIPIQTQAYPPLQDQGVIQSTQPFDFLNGLFSPPSSYLPNMSPGLSPATLAWVETLDHSFGSTSPPRAFIEDLSTTNQTGEKRPRSENDDRREWRKRMKLMKNSIEIGSSLLGIRFPELPSIVAKEAHILFDYFMHKLAPVVSHLSLIAWSATHLSTTGHPWQFIANETTREVCAHVERALKARSLKPKQSAKDSQALGKEDETLLACLVILCGIEICRGSKSTWATPLKLARKVVEQLDEPGMISRLDGPGKWLMQNYVYHEFMSSAFCLEGPCFDSGAYAEILGGKLNTYMGSSMPVFEIIGEISRLAVYRSTFDLPPSFPLRNNPAARLRDLSYQASRLEVSLDECKPLHKADDKYLDDAFKCYVLAAKLYLKQVVWRNNAQSLTNQVLVADLLEAIRLVKGTPAESGLLFPCTVTGIDCLSSEDRENIVVHFDDLLVNCRIDNIRNAFELVEEIWERNDHGRIWINWAELSREKGWNISFA
ncbi:Zn(2)-C6 fungal-type DNA-binding domain [Phaffia rhodozyma]|uniref:Zn(2)-C6 fungal-type DNA-binding domain n=1 Tax=Phaffia rhodozyma TaxID=264483 RepID=A0A0F7SPU9_PHARH|nr:Zn(2)-C6 fungal-type DNA-binding domain [Phaffia rhodozyma]